MSQHNDATVVTSKIDLKAVLLLQDKPCYAEILLSKTNCGKYRSGTVDFIFLFTQGIAEDLPRGNLFQLIHNMSQENEQ
jgi:hypothetical protein